VEKFSCC